MTTNEQPQAAIRIRSRPFRFELARFAGDEESGCVSRPTVYSEDGLRGLTFQVEQHVSSSPTKPKPLSAMVAMRDSVDRELSKSFP